MSNDAQRLLALVGEQRKGRFAESAGKALNDLLDACAETRKPGTLTLTFTITPEGKVDGAEQFSFKDKTAIKAPLPEMGSSILFRTEGGMLTRRDPRQAEFPTIEAGRVASNG